MTIVIDIVTNGRSGAPRLPSTQPDQSGIAAGQRPRREKAHLEGVSSMKSYPIQ